MIRRLIDYYFYALVKLAAIRYRNQKLLVLDIDNTLAYTYESLLVKPAISHRERIARLKMKDKVVSFINDTFQEHKRVYLTARNYRYYSTTLKWLYQKRLNTNPLNVFLTPTAASKLKYIKLLKEYCDITYIDDLSYNHEKEKVLYYQDVINQVNEWGINYIGYSDILKIEKG